MTDFVSEDQCTVCSAVPPTERHSMRKELDIIPLRQPICDACLVAFWRNMGVQVNDSDEPIKH